MAKNYFAGLGNTKESKDANYVTPGHYIMRLDNVRMKENRKGDAIFVVEQTPIHLLRADLLEEQGGCMNGIPTRSNQEGIPCTHLISFAGAGAEMAMPNIKAFAVAVIDGFAEAAGQKDADGNDLQEQIMALVVSDEQPLAGTMVEVIARSIKTRAKKDFTKVTYAQVISNEQRLQMGLISQEEFDLLKQAQDEG